MDKVNVKRKTMHLKNLEFEIEKGELVLIENINANHPMVLGIYKGVFKTLSSDKSKPSLEFSWSVRVWPSISIGGVRLPHIAGNWTGYYSTSRMGNIYVGPSDIATALSKKGEKWLWP